MTGNVCQNNNNNNKTWVDERVHTVGKAHTAARVKGSAPEAWRCTEQIKGTRWRLSWVMGPDVSLWITASTTAPSLYSLYTSDHTATHISKSSVKFTVTQRWYCRSDLQQQRDSLSATRCNNHGVKTTDWTWMSPRHQEEMVVDFRRSKQGKVLGVHMTWSTHITSFWWGRRQDNTCITTDGKMCRNPPTLETLEPELSGSITSWNPKFFRAALLGHLQQGANRIIKNTFMVLFSWINWYKTFHLILHKGPSSNIRLQTSFHCCCTIMCVTKESFDS